MPYCLSTAASQSIEDVAAANDKAAEISNESNSVHSYNGKTPKTSQALLSHTPLTWMRPGPNGGDAKSPRFFQLYMGHDDDVTLSLLNRAWKSGYDVLMLTTDTWQLGWRPTDINIANYMCARSYLTHRRRL